MSGYIFAIGGGNNLDTSIFKKMIDVSKNKKVLLITDASTYAFTKHEKKTKKYFNKFNDISISSIKISDVKSNRELLSKINSNGIIYFTGGYQSNLLKEINKFNQRYNIELRSIFKEYLLKGGIIGGTSAGASILGRLMPTGFNSGIRNNNYYLGKKKIGKNIQKVEYSLDLLPYIIDQHFSEKKRHDRGIGMAIDNKMKLIGIDENTAFYQKYNSNNIYKLGRNKITIYDGRNAKFKSKDNKLYITNI